MEADWEFEIGGDAPIIDAAWSGFVDLRISPARVDEIAEVAQFSGLRDALLRLNRPRSPVWTAKCDVWQPDEFDPDELNAKPEQAKHALACYLDLLPRSNQQWTLSHMVAQSCDAWRTHLRGVSLSNCRADFVIRRAWITPDLQDTGITAYLSACGPDLAAAHRALSAALAAVVDAIAPV